MTVLLATRENKRPMATDDEAYELLVADPEIGAFPQASSKQTVDQQVSSQTVLTSFGDNAAQNAEVLVENDNKSWINNRWRPIMAWTYTIICICDFVLFPVLWSLLQAHYKGQVTNQYQPITLMGAGLVHLAFGAILGIAAYGRTKEKISGVTS